MEITFKEVEVQKLNLQPGEVLIVQLRGEEFTNSEPEMDTLKRGFQGVFPNNRIILLAMPADHNIDLTVASESEYPTCDGCTECHCDNEQETEGE